MAPNCSSFLYPADHQQGPTHTSSARSRFLPVKGQWAPKALPAHSGILNEHQTAAEVRKKGFYCITAIYTYELLLKNFAHDLKTRHYSCSGGHIPMATNQTWTGAFHTIWVRLGAALVRSSVICLLNFSP